MRGSRRTRASRGTGEPDDARRRQVCGHSSIMRDIMRATATSSQRIMRPPTSGVTAERSPRSRRVALSFVLFSIVALRKVVTFQHIDRVAADPHRSTAAIDGPKYSATS
ncbi:hypothetical protein THAOC_04013, partial [Thalassiosira oceanica]